MAFTQGKQKVDEENFLELWQYFQDRADKLKERQWTVGTWILTLLSGLIAFSLDENTLIFSFSQTGIIVSKPLPALVLGIVGILICLYGWVVVFNYGTHIQRNWDRADRVKDKIIGFEFFWTGKASDRKPESPSLPKESIYLMVIIGGFLILYTGISIIARSTLP